MNAQQLKNAILQEAISGRLVPQDPNDEPASVLLDKIRAEKKRLVKEGKLKKKDLEEKPISEDEIPFEIPDSWEWVRIGTITTVLGGKRIPAGRKLSQENTGHIYIRVSDMKENTISTDNLLYVPEDIFPLISRYIITKEDVFITVAGTIGRVGKIPPELDGANLTENADRLVFSNIDQDWLINCLQSFFVQSQISDVTTKVGQPKLAIIRIQNLKVPLPPLAEQKRIVAKIEELMPKVEEYGKAQKALDKLNAELPERLKKSILQEAISGRLVPQDPNDEPASVLLDKIRAEKKRLVKEGKLKKKDLEEIPIPKDNIPFDIPESWEWCKLEFVTSLLEGEKRKGDFVCLDAKFLRGKSTGDLINNGKFVRKGDYIILVDGENSGEVFNVPCDGYMGSTFKQLWLPKSLYLPFILHVIRYYKNTLRNTKKGAAIPHLNKKIFNNLIIGIPPLAEQKRIVAKIEELFKEVDSLQQP